MNLTLLSRLTDDFAPRDAKPVVTTDGLVETTCIELTSLTITIRGVEGVSKVRSVERGELKFTQLKGGVQINMPLNVADILLIDR